MLILTHADGFGVDLHQLCQRVLQTSGDGNGRAQIHIILPQLLRCQLRGGIDGCACLTDYHVRDGQVFLLDGLHDKLLRFPSAGAVANGCVLDVVRLHQRLQTLHGVCPTAFAGGGIEDSGIQHLAGAVHHSGFAAVDESRIQSQGHKPLHGRLHEQRFQIPREGLDRTLTGLFHQLIPQLPTQGGENEPLVGVRCGGFHQLGAGRTAMNPFLI